ARTLTGSSPSFCSGGSMRSRVAAPALARTPRAKLCGLVDREGAVFDERRDGAGGGRGLRCADMDAHAAWDAVDDEGFPADRVGRAANSSSGTGVRADARSNVCHTIHGVT